MRITIENGRLLDPAGEIDAMTSLHLADGRVLALGDAPAGFVPDRLIDAAGCWVLPGVVDLSARLREPGFEYKATLESEIGAALAGGVTSLSCPPDTDPPLDEPGLVEMLKHRARLLDGARVYPIGALTIGLRGEVLTEMAELTEAGCVGFGLPGPLMANTQTLYHAMQYASSFGLTVWLRPQDAHLGAGGIAHAGAVASRLGLAGVPAIAEAIALATIFELVRATGCRVHLCRLSSAAGLDLVRQARREGLALSCDVSVHHLHLADIDIGHFDSLARVDPPFRSVRDRDAIRLAVRDGVVDAVCSDHTPVDDDAKQLPFAEAEPGVTGLELLLPLTMKWAAEMDVDPRRAVSLITDSAARILGIEAGTLAPGRVADVCVFDPAHAWRVDRHSLRSQSAHTPYLGRELVGRVRATLVGGRIAFES